MELVNLKPNEQVEGNYVLKFKKPVQQYKNGYRFELRIGDSTKEVMLKYWGGPDEQKVQKLYDSVHKDDVIHIKGMSNTYNDNMEISVNKDGGEIRPCKKGEYDISDFVKTTSRDIEEMVKELGLKVKSVEDPEMKTILEAFFLDEEFMNEFKKAPAAMYRHHNCVGGLLEHTLDVTGICEDLTKYHPELDKDLVVTGALLHDIGKIHEFDVTTSIKATTESMLLGHIVKAVEVFHEKTSGIKNEVLLMKLKHILVSHHGQLEYGSPKKPAFPEAMLIHMVDNLDATVELMIRQKEEASTEDEQIYTKDFGNIYLK